MAQPVLILINSENFQMKKPPRLAQEKCELISLWKFKLNQQFLPVQFSYLVLRISQDSTECQESQFKDSGSRQHNNTIYE
jgi:hypothetical protein